MQNKIFTRKLSTEKDVRMIITADSSNLIGAFDPKGWSSISIATRNSITLLQLKSHYIPRKKEKKRYFPTFRVVPIL